LELEYEAFLLPLCESLSLRLTSSLYDLVYESVLELERSLCESLSLRLTSSLWVLESWLGESLALLSLILPTPPRRFCSLSLRLVS